MTQDHSIITLHVTFINPNSLGPYTSTYQNFIIHIKIAVNFIMGMRLCYRISSRGSIVVQARQPNDLSSLRHLFMLQTYS